MIAAAPHNPPFRADVVGSLLRPPHLKVAREEAAAGRITPEALRAVEDAAIRDVVALQEACGLKVVTDGEYRRRTYFADFYERGLGGVTLKLRASATPWDYTNDKGETIRATAPHIHDRVRWTAPIHAEDFRALASVTKVMPKVTIPSPMVLHYFGGREGISRTAYPDLDLFWSDIVDAFRREIGALYEAGCRYVQIDETAVAKFGDPKIQAVLASRGDDWRDLLKLYTSVLNAVVADKPAGMHIALHSCRGNSAGHWQAQGGYDLVAETVFGTFNVDSFFLEYDSPRAGDFSPLRFVPKDKTVVLGLISTKSPVLEAMDVLEARVAAATAYIDHDQLCISPQCGFASSMVGNDISWEEQEAKLRLVVAAAAKFWPS